MIKSKQIQRPQLVLVVDDQEINRDVLGTILEDTYELIFAGNGEQALRLMREYAEKLSIVLLDLVMPVMNGFEVLAAVQKDEQLARIPIIVLTAEKNAELQALQMGAADFITKPFDAHEVIIARVSRIIELKEGQQLISAACWTVCRPRSPRSRPMSASAFAWASCPGARAWSPSCSLTGPGRPATWSAAIIRIPS